MTRTYRLLPESSVPAYPAGAGGTVLTLETASVLCVAEDGRLSLESEAPRDGRQGLLWFEPVEQGGRQVLLVAVPADLPPESRPRRGGRPLPRVGLLEVGDVLSLADGTLVHLTAHREVLVSAPSPDLVGCDCPVCRVPIDETSRVYRCRCGVAIHCEVEGAPGTNGAERAEPLQCTELSPSCPECGEAVNLDGGYEFLPEGWHDLAD